MLTKDFQRRCLWNGPSLRRIDPGEKEGYFARDTHLDRILMHLCMANEVEFKYHDYVDFLRSQFCDLAAVSVILDVSPAVSVNKCSPRPCPLLGPQGGGGGSENI